MDFVRYADASAHLVNAALPDAAAVRALLHTRPWLHDLCTDRDSRRLRRFQRQLRPVFEASGAGETRAVDALRSIDAACEALDPARSRAGGAGVDRSA